MTTRQLLSTQWRPAEIAQDTRAETCQLATNKSRGKLILFVPRLVVKEFPGPSGFLNNPPSGKNGAGKRWEEDCAALSGTEPGENRSFARRCALRFSSLFLAFPRFVPWFFRKYLGQGWWKRKYFAKSLERGRPWCRYFFQVWLMSSLVLSSVLLFLKSYTRRYPYTLITFTPGALLSKQTSETLSCRLLETKIRRSERTFRVSVHQRFDRFWRNFPKLLLRNQSKKQFLRFFLFFSVLKLSIDLWEGCIILALPTLIARKNRKSAFIKNRRHRFSDQPFWKRLWWQTLPHLMWLVNLSKSPPILKI